VVGVEPDAATATRDERDNLEFRRGRIQDLDQVCHPSWADLVIGRAVFHWLALGDYKPSYVPTVRSIRWGG
jgi:hypothetical protein